MPALTEMQEALKPLYSERQEEEISNMTGGIFNAFFGLGLFLGPIFGSFFMKRIQFQLTSDIVAILCLVFSVLYFFIADGKSAVKRLLP